MPLKGFKCPSVIDSQFEVGSRHDVTDCLYKCEAPCIPREIIYTIWEHTIGNPHQGSYISVTSLLGCDRALWLTRNIDYWEWPRNMWYSIRGALIHSITECEGLRDWMSEFEVRMKIGDFYLNGRLDGFQPSINELTDKKTMKDGGIRYILDGAKDKDVWQVNIYKYVGEHPANPKERIEIKSIKIIYLTMSEVIETGTKLVLRESLYWGKDNIPRLKKNAIIDPVNKKYQLITYDIPPVPIFKEEDVKEFIDERFHTVAQYLHGTNVPPLLEEIDKDMARWKCCPYYCEVYNECQELI